MPKISTICQDLKSFELYYAVVKYSSITTHANLITILGKAYFFETNCLLLRYYKKRLL